MLRKVDEPDLDCPIKEKLESFKDLRDALVNPPVLALKERGRPFMLYTDASKYSMGVTLFKQKSLKNEKEYEKVFFWRKTFTDSESRYRTTELEFLSVVWGIRTLREYIEGTKLIFRSDQDALRCIISFSDPNGRLALWWFKLSSFDFTVQYRPGFKNQVSDALYR